MLLKNHYEENIKKGYDFAANCQLLEKAILQLNPTIKIDCVEKYILDNSLIKMLNKGLGIKTFGKHKSLFLYAPNDLDFDKLIDSFFTLMIMGYQPILLQSPFYFTKAPRKLKSFKSRSYIYCLNILSIIDNRRWRIKRSTNKLLKDTELRKFIST